MDPDAIRRARAAARELGALAAGDPERPRFHFRPPGGWMNDPIGAVHHAGAYHVFYQHNPFGDTWANMHWGHARSPDLVRWEHLPVALAPDPELGEGHCFSGSVWVGRGGRPILFYSSFPPEDAPRPAEQWAVRADAELQRFERIGPVLKAGSHDGPPFGDDWRDPFVFEAGGRVFLLLGATLAESGEAAIPIWEAGNDDLLSWRYRGLLRRDRTGEVGFFECPALLPAPGASAGPVALAAGGREPPELRDPGFPRLLLYSAHRPVDWLAGDFDPAAASFTERSRGVLDHSPSFYAASAFLREPRGRTVVVGWVRGWPAGRDWNGAMSLPRVVELGDGGRLWQRPLPELEGLRREHAEVEPGTEVGSRALVVPGPGWPQAEVRTVLEPGEAAACGLRLRAPGAERAAAVLRWRPAAGRVELEAEVHALRLQVDGPPASGVGTERVRRVLELPAGSSTRTVGGANDPAGDAERALELRLFRDRSILEVFVGGGAAVCTEVLADGGGPLRVEAFAEGGTARARELTVWEMSSIW